MGWKEILDYIFNIDHILIILFVFTTCVFIIESLKRKAIQDIFYEDALNKGIKLSIGRVFLFLSFMICIFYWTKQLLSAQPITFPDSLENVVMFLLMYNLGSKGLSSWSNNKYKFSVQSPNDKENQQPSSPPDNQ